MSIVSGALIKKVARYKLPALKVAHFILSLAGSMSYRKLEKLVYFCQVHHLLYHDFPLFLERIEAWPEGPAIPSLMAQWPGSDSYTVISADILPALSRLPRVSRQVIEEVVDMYFSYDAYDIVRISRMDGAWIKVRYLHRARRDDECTKEISHYAIREYSEVLAVDGKSIKI